MIDLIVGVDCATQPKRVGLARARRRNDRFEVTDALACIGAKHPVEIVAEWIASSQTALIALDAPLGWPSALGRELVSHQAGEPVIVPSELLFRRLTDRFVAERTGKTPLDVGADRIARTAHSALLFLYHLRQELREDIPLAWSTPLSERVEAIEVYPAATLLSRGASLRGYKHTSGLEERLRILEIMGRELGCETLDAAVSSNVDCLDAVACVLGGVDFIEGRATPPSSLDVAKREGWIWFAEREPAVNPPQALAQAGPRSRPGPPTR
jgi:predicted RNase H-like nuclease